MSFRIVRARGIVVAVFALSGCAASPFAADELKVVTGDKIDPFGAREQCMRLHAGDRIEFTFVSTEAVDSNVSYREGKTVVMPLAREKVREDAGILPIALANDYCLTWEAGPAGAVIDYRIRFKRNAVSAD